MVRGPSCSRTEGGGCSDPRGCALGVMAHFTEESLRLSGEGLGLLQQVVRVLTQVPKGQTAPHLPNSDASIPVISGSLAIPLRPASRQPGPTELHPPSWRMARVGGASQGLARGLSKHTRRLTFFKMQLSFICQHLARRKNKCH